MSEIIEDGDGEICEGCESTDRLTVVTIEGNDMSLCDSCESNTGECSRCHDNYYCDDLTFFDGEYWCESCADYVLRFCHSCDNLYYNSRGCDCQVDDDDDESCDSIHQYSYKPYPFFHSTSDGQIEIFSSGHQGSALYVGCELETETIHGSRRETVGAFSNFPFFYLKEDCSLTNGYEIVSHPATFEAWALLFPEIVSRFATASNLGVRAWTRSNCGLHFHLSRASFTQAHTMRFHKFIMENATEMIGFAGRESGYGSFYSDNGKASDRAKGYQQPVRGCAINYYNDNTIELRFFRPTLDAVGFVGIIQFVFAVHEYTKQISVRDLVAGSFPFRDFVLWLEGRDEYAQALARIVSRLSVKAVL